MVPLAPYRFDVMFGSVRLGSPTGRFVQDEQGWWREVYTDKVYLDAFGREVSRDPTPTYARMRFDGDPCRKPWWRRLLRR